MSLLKFLHKGSNAVVAIYDTRFGTATDANGWITFGLKSGCRRIYCDAAKANDTGDGLTPATAKKTYAAAYAVWVGAGSNPGDQLMLAQGGTYTDPGDTTLGDLTNHGGASMTYPAAVLSYDSADATNQAKFGRATGANMPTLISPAPGGSFTVSSLSMQAAFGQHYVVVQGVNFDAQAASNAKLRFVNRRDGLAFQNCRLNAIRIEYDNEATIATNGRAQSILFSKCAFFGQWNATNGNSSGWYAAGVDGLWCQDCIFVHCGWKIGAARGDDTSGAYAAGGASILGHGQYYHATNINGRFDRCVYVDSAADGLNIRGAAVATCISTLDEPVAGAIGGFSTDYHEAAGGVLITVDDWLIMGGADINTNQPRGFGPGITNTISGSYLRNLAMFDNPNLGQVNNDYFRASHLGLNGSGSNVEIPIDVYCLIDLAHGYNYATTNFQTLSGDTSKIHLTYTSCVTDLLAPTGSGNSTSNGSTFAGYKTRDQVVTAILTAAGITPGASYTARKAQLVNLMLWRPDLTWSQALVAVGLPAMGLTPKYPTASLPNLSAESPAAIY
jgi:hypothetical protein